MNEPQLDYRHYDRKVVEDLEAEVERLRAKLSPLEDKEFTKLFKGLAAKHSALAMFGIISVAGVDNYVTTPHTLWNMVMGDNPNIHDITKLGRTLRALGWVQTAKDGKRYYIIPVSEYHEQLQ